MDDDAAELVSGEWCLPVMFLGRFNPDEDDFEGNSFFAHPQRPEGDADPAELGGGLAPFRREDKRYCGFLYLRPNRTGNRALSLGRGSLIDTIVRLKSDKAGSLWTSALGALNSIDLAEATPGFREIRSHDRATGSSGGLAVMARRLWPGDGAGYRVRAGISIGEAALVLSDPGARRLCVLRVIDVVAAGLGRRGGVPEGDRDRGPAGMVSDGVPLGRGRLCWPCEGDGAGADVGDRHPDDAGAGVGPGQ